MSTNVQNHFQGIKIELCLTFVHVCECLCKNGTAHFIAIPLISKVIFDRITQEWGHRYGCCKHYHPKIIMNLNTQSLLKQNFPECRDFTLMSIKLDYRNVSSP